MASKFSVGDRVIYSYNQRTGTVKGARKSAVDGVLVLVAFDLYERFVHEIPERSLDFTTVPRPAIANLPKPPQYAGGC